MTNKQGGMIILLLVAILAVMGAFPMLDRRPTQEWEYHTDAVADKDFTPAMQIAGRRGWELIYARRVKASEYSSEMMYEMIFKRPLR